MTPNERAENIGELVLSLTVDGIADGDKIAAAVADAPPEDWIDWDTQPPTPEAGEIVAQDCLGFFHRATHLIGDDRGMWAIRWMKLRHPAGRR